MHLLDFFHGLLARPRPPAAGCRGGPPLRSEERAPSSRPSQPSQPRGGTRPAPPRTRSYSPRTLSSIIRRVSLFSGMRHILELAVLLLAARHADEEAVPALDDLDVVDHEALVEDDRHERFELLLLNRKDLDLCDLHFASLSVIPGQPSACARERRQGQRTLRAAARKPLCVCRDPIDRRKAREESRLYTRQHQSWDYILSVAPGDDEKSGRV